MNTVIVSSVANSDSKSKVALPEVSLFRLYTLRACYLLMAVGLAIYVWPIVISHTNELATSQGVRFALLAGLGATAALGLIAFALPLFLAHQINEATAENISACLMVAIFIPLIPWRYVWARHAAMPGDRWRSVR